MNPDFVDLLRAFSRAEVRFLVVGAYALALHGRPRATGDLDVWVDATPDNAARVMRALAAFGAPMDAIAEGDFATPGITYQIGIVPRRIDILTDLTGLTFNEAWPARLSGRKNVTSAVAAHGRPAEWCWGEARPSRALLKGSSCPGNSGAAAARARAEQRAPRALATCRCRAGFRAASPRPAFPRR